MGADVATIPAQGDRAARAAPAHGQGAGGLPGRLERAARKVASHARPSPARLERHRDRPAGRRPAGRHDAPGARTLLARRPRCRTATGHRRAPGRDGRRHQRGGRGGARRIRIRRPARCGRPHRQRARQRHRGGHRTRGAGGGHDHRHPPRRRAGSPHALLRLLLSRPPRCPPALLRSPELRLGSHRGRRRLRGHQRPRGRQQSGAGRRDPLRRQRLPGGGGRGGRPLRRGAAEDRGAESPGCQARRQRRPADRRVGHRHRLALRPAAGRHPTHGHRGRDQRPEPGHRAPEPGRSLLPGHDPDRRGDQPGQQRRRPDQRARRGGGHQHLHLLGERRLHRHRLRRAQQPRALGPGGGARVRPLSAGQLGRDALPAHQRDHGGAGDQEPRGLHRPRRHGRLARLARRSGAPTT